MKAGDLVGPKAIAFPVSIDFWGRPFNEPVLFRIADTYEEGGPITVIHLRVVEPCPG